MPNLNTSKTGQTSCSSWTEAAVRGRQEAGGNKCQSSHNKIFPDFMHQREKKKYQGLSRAHSHLDANLIYLHWFLLLYQLFNSLLGNLTGNVIPWMGHFNHSILLASHKCSSLLGGGTLIHQIPWCLLCLPLAATICFGTAALWTARRHAVIFPSDSTEKGKHINYSSLGADFIYPSRNEIFVCVCV